MIQNKICSISNKDVKDIILKAKSLPNIHVAELDGKTVQSLQKYLCEIENVFKFPGTCLGLLGRYLDWMTDLGWLKCDAYILVIHNYKDFLARNFPLKKMIMDDFNEIILPWWQGEVIKWVVDGKAKSFCVYMVS